jgi:hypothetical protein
MHVCVARSTARDIFFVSFGWSTARDMMVPSRRGPVTVARTRLPLLGFCRLVRRTRGFGYKSEAGREAKRKHINICTLLRTNYLLCAAGGIDHGNHASEVSCVPGV